MVSRYCGQLRSGGMHCEEGRQFLSRAKVHSRREICPHGKPRKKSKGLITVISATRSTSTVKRRTRSGNTILAR